MILIDPDTINSARNGDRSALDRLIRDIRQPIYNLAIRMLASPADADDAAQEIIIKIITNLGNLKEPAAAGGWAMRIAVRHLVRERKAGHLEAQRFTFRRFGDDLMDGLETIKDDDAPSPEDQTLLAQVKIGCTLALLTCLSRPLRAAYILGEIYELPDGEAAQMLEVERPAFRQRLKRARALVSGFTRRYCGLAHEDAPCRCEGRVTKARELGRIGTTDQPKEIMEHKISEVRRTISRLEAGRRSAALMRSNPALPGPTFDLDVLLDRKLA